MMRQLVPKVGALLHSLLHPLFLQSINTSNMGIQGKIVIKSRHTCATNLLDVFVKAMARKGGRLLVVT
jgi:hypothetical protein